MGGAPSPLPMARRPPRFDAARKRREARRRLGRRVALWLGIAAVLAAAWAVHRWLSPPTEWQAVAAPIALCGEGRGAPACVIDGDTLAVGRERVRFTGFDAPELDVPCAAERRKAIQARAELHRWLTAGPFEWTGGPQPPRDRYGRALREARRGDDRLAGHMIARGLAGETGWGSESIDWCG